MYDQMTTIHTVTVFQKIEKSNTKYPNIINRRCVGYFADFDEAENAVLENFSDIHENMYDYVIIEEMEPGLKLSDITRSLYHWNGNSYEKIDIPETLKYLSNFGMG